MKRIRYLIILSLYVSHSFAQSQKQIDSVNALFTKESEPLKRFYYCIFFAELYAAKGQPDSVPKYTAELFKIAAQQKNDSLLMRSYETMAFYFDYKTDTKQELEYYLKALKIAEKKYTSALPYVYLGLSAAYEDLPNFELSLKYLLKVQNTPLNKWRNSQAANIYWHFSHIYLGMNKFDSALHYIQLANEYLLKDHEKTSSSLIFFTTGNIYEKLGNNKLAEDYYKNSVDPEVNGRKAYGDAAALGEYGRFLLKQSQFQKAKYYELAALAVAKMSQAKKPFLDIVENLRKTYEALHQTDSAYYYSKLELVYKDSLFNQEKINAVLDMTIAEDIRQKEEAISQFEEATRHKHNLQYSGIAIALIAFIILSLALSRSIVVKTKFIEFFGILGLLAVFEFINLLIHPYLADATSESPVLMLLILIAIGALLVPLHHRLEKWLTHVMVEKNKKIRLEAAKKTIAALEGNQRNV